MKRAPLPLPAVLFLSVFLSPLLAGCNLPGRPGPDPEVPRPDAVTNFDKLYSENCAGCHGEKGANGPATDLANPEYQAWIDDNSLREAIAKGQKGTLMPGFGTEAGGQLTDNQINALVAGIRAKWKPKSDPFAGQTPPPYQAANAGNPAAGQAVYQAACARCHAPNQPGGNILDGAFLGLITPQTIRTTIIPGRPDAGQPDWRNMVPGHALTDAQIADVTAWIMAQRPANPGQPYPNSQPASPRPGEQQPTAEKKVPGATRHP